MSNKEQILNEALAKLAAGQTPEQVVLAHPELQAELKPLLETASLLYSLPKNEISSPAMRRKYLLEPAPVVWLSWLGISRWATVSLSLVLIITALAGTSYAAFTAMPGQTLFKVKTTVENIRVSLASSPNDKAQLQVQFAEQRLQEVQQVLQNPSSGSDQKTAAVNELVATTNSTVKAVSAAAHDPSATANHPLVASIEAITKQQTTILNQAKQQPAVSQVANSALASTMQSASQVAQIKHYLEVASSEQTLSRASSDPNTVTISGFINQVAKNSVLVEKTTFMVNANTVITDGLGNNISIADLSTTSKISIIGTKDNGVIVAQQISVINPDLTGIVEGDSTTTPVSASSTPKTGSTTPAITVHKSKDASSTSVEISPTPTPVPTTDPNKATGSFIIENP